MFKMLYLKAVFYVDSRQAAYYVLEHTHIKRYTPLLHLKIMLLLLLV